MDPSFQIRDFLRIIRGRWGIVAAMLGAAVLAAILSSIFTTPAYLSTVTIEIEQPSGYVIRSDIFGGMGGGRVTPEAQAELVRSDPYQMLTESLLTLADGYGIDLTTRRTQVDMVALFEEDLFHLPLPRYTGYLAANGRTATVLDPGRPEDGVSTSLRPVSSPSQLRPRDLSSTQKEEAIKQAGALAALARRLNIDAFRLSADELPAVAQRVMDSGFVRSLPGSPTANRSWEDIPAADKGIAIETAYRIARKKRPDKADKLAALDKISTFDIKDTSMLGVQFEAPSADRATQGADAIAAVAVWKDQYTRKEEAQLNRQFVEARLAEERQQERNLDRDQYRFKKATGTVDLEEEAKASVGRVAQLSAAIDDIDASIREATKHLDELSKRLDQFPKRLSTPTITENPHLGQLKDELYAAELNLQSLKSRYTERHPDVRDAELKVKGLQEAIQRERERSGAGAETVTEQTNPVRAELEKNLADGRANLDALYARRRAMEQVLAKEQQHAAAIPAKVSGLSGMLRDSEVSKVKRELLEQRLMEARINEATKLSATRVVELALEPGRKVRPRRLMNLALGVLVGLFLGVAGALFSEAMDSTVRTRQQLSEAIGGLPVLACVPRTRRVRAALRSTGSSSAQAEAYRSARSAVLAVTVDHPPKTLLVCPAGPSDEAADVAIGMATQAAAGASVVLVDADLRRPTLHHLLGVDPGVGLAEVLAGKQSAQDALRPTGVPNLRLLRAGTAPAGPELLHADSASRLLQELSGAADMVLLCSPPVGLVSDALPLAALVDGCILVVDGGATERDLVQRAAEALRTVGAKLLGAVLVGPDPMEDGLARRYGDYFASGQGAGTSVVKGK